MSDRSNTDTTIEDSSHQDMFNASLLDQEAIKQSEQNNSPAKNIRLASHKVGRGKLQMKWKDKTS